jgi:hypothetical protein
MWTMKQASFFPKDEPASGGAASTTGAAVIRSGEAPRESVDPR